MVRTAFANQPNAGVYKKISMLWACLSIIFVSAEEISNLPGVDWNLNFKHYNGFFQVSDTHHFHYWFVESQNSPENDPLIFWFTGGPGCSSIDGLLNEMGPFIVSKDGKKLIKNEFSWNKFASVVYIESPAGVGYSYATDGNITANDDQISLENYKAVKQFFQTFPDFRSHETYITGGSYAGVYVPTLTAHILDGQDDFPINLKGIAIENGYLSCVLFLRTTIRFAYEHGFLAENIWSTLKNECCNGRVDNCNFTQFTGQCNKTVQDVLENLFWHSGVNIYDIHSDCAETEHFDLPCSDNSNINSYINNPEVREALNIPPNLGKWSVCHPDVMKNYKWQSPEMAPYVRKIVKAGVPVLLFYGDTDMACNFMMGQQFAQNLGLNRKMDKQPWKVEGSSQVAGFQTVYDGLTFMTVKGGGHAPAQYRRLQTYYAVKQFLMNQPI